MKRARTLGLVLVCGLVLVLVGSLVLGLGGEGDAPARGAAAPVAGGRDRVRVEVYNAAGIPGLARLATERLRDRGFDVVFYGNARTFHPDTSLVIHRAGDAEAAESVADAIGIERVRSQPDSTLFHEVTVVIGRDWSGRGGGEAEDARR